MVALTSALKQQGLTSQEQSGDACPSRTPSSSSSGSENVRQMQGTRQSEEGHQDPSSPESQTMGAEIDTLPNAASSTEDEGDGQTCLEFFNGHFFGGNTQRRFREAPTRCLANTRGNMRCENPSTTSHRKFAKDRLDALESLVYKGPDPHCVNLVQKLVAAAMCRKHQTHLGKRILDWAGLEDQEDGPAAREVARDEHPRQERASSCPPRTRCPTPDQWASTGHDEPPENPRYNLRNDALRADQASKTEIALRDGLFTAYIPANVRNFDPAQELTRWLLKSVSGPVDSASGVLYVALDKQYPGYLKIGRTELSTAERFKKIPLACKQDLKEIYVSPVLKHVARLERLVFAALHAYRVRRACYCRVRRGHVEWFKVADAQCLIVIEKCMDWLQLKPYHETTGQLQDQFRDTLGPLCNSLMLPGQVSS